MGNCTSSSNNNKAVETPPPSSVPWKGVWKEISTTDSNTQTSVKGPITMQLGRHTQAYQKRTLEVNFGGSDRIKIVTGGTFLLLKDSSSETLLGLAKKVGRNYVIYRPQPFYSGQPNSGKHQGLPYYLYATIQPDGTVMFHNGGSGSGSGSGNFESFKLHNGPLNSFRKHCQKPGKPHPFAEWKYNAQDKRHHITIRGSGYDIGLIMLLVVIGDLRDTDESMNKLTESAVQGTVSGTALGIALGS